MGPRRKQRFVPFLVAFSDSSPAPVNYYLYYVAVNSIIRLSTQYYRILYYIIWLLQNSTAPHEEPVYMHSKPVPPLFEREYHARKS